MCDEKKRTENSKAHDGRRDTTMPHCCGPMAERLLRAFGETEEDDSNRESAQDTVADWVRSCASMMERMASRCCGRSAQQRAGDG
jgi:hypothetical protein